MEFLAVFVQTTVKMLMIAAVALVGVRFGKTLRDKKDARQAVKKDTE